MQIVMILNTSVTMTAVVSASLVQPCCEAAAVGSEGNSAACSACQADSADVKWSTVASVQHAVVMRDQYQWSLAWSKQCKSCMHLQGKLPLPTGFCIQQAVSLMCANWLLYSSRKDCKEDHPACMPRALDSTEASHHNSNSQSKGTMATC